MEREAPALAGLAAVLLLAAGCAGESRARSVDELPPELRQSVIISTREPGARIPESGTFAVDLRAARLESQSGPDAMRTHALIRNALEDAFGRRGFRPGFADTADLVVRYVAAMEADLDDEQIRNIYCMSPGLSGLGHEKGTLILEVAHGQGGRPVWRGAVQARIDLTLEEEVRAQRVTHAVEALVDRFPN
jgi:hypothetical protein